MDCFHSQNREYRETLPVALAKPSSIQHDGALLGGGMMIAIAERRCR